MNNTNVAQSEDRKREQNWIFLSWEFYPLEPIFFCQKIKLYKTTYKNIKAGSQIENLMETKSLAKQEVSFNNGSVLRWNNLLCKIISSTSH